MPITRSEKDVAQYLYQKQKMHYPNLIEAFTQLILLKNKSFRDYRYQFDFLFSKSQYIVVGGMGKIILWCMKCKVISMTFTETIVLLLAKFWLININTVGFSSYDTFNQNSQKKSSFSMVQEKIKLETSLLSIRQDFYTYGMILVCRNNLFFLWSGDQAIRLEIKCIYFLCCLSYKG